MSRTRIGMRFNQPTDEELMQHKIDNMIMNALPKLEAEAKEYVFQNFPTTSPVIRNILVNNAQDFQLTNEQVQILKENGDIMSVLSNRNSHLAPYGHGRILFQNQYWWITMPQREKIFWALIHEIPVKYKHSVGTKIHDYMVSQHGWDYSGAPFMTCDMGWRELRRLLKEEEYLWGQYLIERGVEYVNERREKIIENIKKNVHDEMRISKQGLTGLF